MLINKVMGLLGCISCIFVLFLIHQYKNKYFFPDRPDDRSSTDVAAIALKLREVPALEKLPSTVRNELAHCCFYEDLEKGITCEYFEKTFVLVLQTCNDLVSFCNI